MHSKADEHIGDIKKGNPNPSLILPFEHFFSVYTLTKIQLSLDQSDYIKRTWVEENWVCGHKVGGCKSAKTFEV